MGYSGEGHQCRGTWRRSLAGLYGLGMWDIAYVRWVRECSLFLLTHVTYFQIVQTMSKCAKTTVSNMKNKEIKKLAKIKKKKKEKTGIIHINSEIFKILGFLRFFFHRHTLPSQPFIIYFSVLLNQLLAFNIRTPQP